MHRRRAPVKRNCAGPVAFTWYGFNHCGLRGPKAEFKAVQFRLKISQGSNPRRPRTTIGSVVLKDSLR